MDEDRRALGLEHAHRFRHHALEQPGEIDLGADLGDHRQEGEFLGADLLDFLDRLKALQENGRLAGHLLEQRNVIGGEVPVMLVDILHHADDLAQRRAHGHADDVARLVAGALVDGAVETRIGIGIVDEQGLAGLEDMARNA